MYGIKQMKPIPGSLLALCASVEKTGMEEEGLGQFRCNWTEQGPHLCHT